MKETTVEDLQTASEVPEVIQLNIGMKGGLYTYRLVKPEQTRKRRVPMLKKPEPNSSVQKRSIVDWIIDKLFGRPATLHSAT